MPLPVFLKELNNNFWANISYWLNFSRDLPHIPLQDVTPSQLISYDTERDLLPLILAQCNYSLEVGKGTLVQYNWDALERQLIDRFIRGRPLIEFKVSKSSNTSSLFTFMTSQQPFWKRHGRHPWLSSVFFRDWTLCSCTSALPLIFLSTCLLLACLINLAAGYLG